MCHEKYFQGDTVVNRGHIGLRTAEFCFCVDTNHTQNCIAGFPYSSSEAEAGSPRSEAGAASPRLSAAGWHGAGSPRSRKLAVSGSGAEEARCSDCAGGKIAFISSPEVTLLSNSLPETILSLFSTPEIENSFFSSPGIGEVGRGMTSAASLSYPKVGSLEDSYPLQLLCLK